MQTFWGGGRGKRGGGGGAGKIRCIMGDVQVAYGLLVDNN